jgi:hypothetical protein
MAVALASGIMFATMITLILVPALYLILEDVRGFFGFERHVMQDVDLADAVVAD